MMKKCPIFFFYIRLIHPESPAALVLQTDDIVLLADGKPPKTFDDIEGKMRENGEVTLQVLRQGRVEEILLKPQELSSEGIRRVLFMGEHCCTMFIMMYRCKNRLMIVVYISLGVFGDPLVQQIKCHLLELLLR